MPYLTVEMQCDEIHSSGADEASGAAYHPGDATARISNPDAENGCEQEPGPLTWLNSARIVTNPENDEVSCLVSVGDPRGAFCFTVRRLSDGRLVIHTPHPGETMAHMETAYRATPVHDALEAVLASAKNARDWIGHSDEMTHSQGARDLFRSLDADIEAARAALDGHGGDYGTLIVEGDFSDDEPDESDDD